MTYIHGLERRVRMRTSSVPALTGGPRAKPNWLVYALARLGFTVTQRRRMTLREAEDVVEKGLSPVDHYFDL